MRLNLTNGQTKHYVTIEVNPSHPDIKRNLGIFKIKRSKKWGFGEIVLKKMSLSVLVHEMTHAALRFVIEEILVDEKTALNKFKNHARIDAYVNEAVPSVVESLFKSYLEQTK